MYSRNTFHNICNFPDPIGKSKFPGHIFSQKYILLRYYSFNKWQGLIRSKTYKMLPDIPIFGTLFLYNMLQKCLRIEAKQLYDQIDSKLITSNIYWKKNMQTMAINEDNCSFSFVYSLLKIKSKADICENILKYVVSTYLLGYGDFSLVLLW